MKRLSRILWFLLGCFIGALLLVQVQTSAQDATPPPSYEERLLRAQERQAHALEALVREVGALRTDLRRAR